MERSEPSLVPEWLKSSGSVTGSGTTFRPISPSDDHAVSKLARNKSSVNHSDHEIGRSSVSDRTSSSYFRRSSISNGSGHMRSYSSFGRNHRNRDWDKDLYEPRDRDKSVVSDYKHRDYVDPPGNIFPGNFEKDGLRRSQSMIYGKRTEAWPTKRAMADSNMAGRNKNSDGNGLLDKGNSVGTVHKAAFDRYFPSLGSEERQAAPEIGRVPSPGLSTVIHGLPMSPSAMIGGDRWTSALAEVPAIVGNGGTGLSSGQQASPSSSASLPLSTSTGLNMAETVAQGPPRSQAAPKISSGTQRLEELAIRQSRQLIPMTPSMPKPSNLNSSDKGKTKAGQQQQHPVSYPLLSPSLRGGPAKADASKTTNVGKLLVLKPPRERNGVSTAAKDNLSPTSSTRAATLGPAVAASVAGSSTSMGPAINPVSPGAERKHVLTVLEKKQTSQAQSRNDFFNLVRKKSMPNSSSVPDAGTAVTASTLDEPGEQEVAPAPVIPEGRDVPSLVSLNGCQPTENKINLTSNDDALHKEGHLKNGTNHVSSLPLFSEEEEAAFLHELGWQENADETALTEEEISAFFRDLSKYMNSKASLKTLQGVQPKFPLLLSSHVGAIGALSSGPSSSNSKLEP